jgi:Trk-type K+ transport system membrane component
MVKDRKTSVLQNVKNSLVEFLYRYIVLHMAYILVITLVVSLIIMLIEGKNPDVMFTHTPNYLDYFFDSMSAITTTGMTTGNLSKYKFSSQVMLLILMQLGSTVMLSLCPVIIRRFQLQRVFKKHKRIIRFFFFC